MTLDQLAYHDLVLLSYKVSTAGGDLDSLRSTMESMEKAGEASEDEHDAYAILVSRMASITDSLESALGDARAISKIALCRFEASADGEAYWELVNHWKAEGRPDVIA